MTIFFHASTVNPAFLWYKYIPVGHPRPFHGNFISTFPRLTAWKAYGYWKVEVNTPLFDIIWRDGLLYFFVIFTMNAANVIIFLTVPQGLRAVNLTLRSFNSYENYLSFDVPLFFYLGPLSYWKLFSPVVWFLISVPPLAKFRHLRLSLEEAFHGPITPKPKCTLTLPAVL